MDIRFWKRWPIVTVAVTIGLSIAITGVLFYVHSQKVMQQQLRSRLESIAAVAALGIDGDTLDVIHTRADMNKPGYRELAGKLDKLRSIANINFAYILRRTEKPDVLQFVADADSLKSPSELDHNRSGIVDADEEASYPGDEYEIHEMPALSEAFLHPSSDPTVTYDQWGALYSGYAPIHRRSTGAVNAVLGIDMRANEFIQASTTIFSPLDLVGVILAGLVSSVLIIVLWEYRQISILHKLNAERSSLLKLTFHQLGEPLTIMKWSLETLRDETHDERLRKIVDDHVVCMDEGLGRLNTIIDTLQMAEKVDLNTLQYIAVPTSLKTLIQNAIGEWESSLAKREQTVEFAMDHDITLSCDHTLIRLVLRQLLENAIEYSPARTNILLNVLARKQDVLITVEDHGFGIPKADIDHLFEKYRRASNAGKHKPDGNGLGLYIANGIIQKAGGKIWVESIEGSGTKVGFTLPT